MITCPAGHKALASHIFSTVAAQKSSQLPCHCCRHLPDDIRVFSVQRVSKGFDCRSMCINRAYHYYVPAAVIGLRTAQAATDTGLPARHTEQHSAECLTAADLAHNQAVLQRLRQVLASFVGDRPFHNYTKRCTFCTSGTAVSQCVHLRHCCLEAGLALRVPSPRVLWHRCGERCACMQAALHPGQEQAAEKEHSAEGGEEREAGGGEWPCWCSTGSRRLRSWHDCGCCGGG